MKKRVSARPVTINGKKGIIYTDKDGKKTIKVGGTAAFRDHNPGNMMYGPRARRTGAIGKDDKGRAIFPNWETGDKAMGSLLKEKFKDKSIRDAISIYAPKNENPTEAYIKHIAKESGLPEDKKMRDMTDEEFKKFHDAMKQFEDSTPGHDLVDLGTNGKPDMGGFPGQLHSGGSGENGTLERHGDQVFRIDPNGSQRGSFFSP